jgi:hypothetical protein
MRNRPSLRSDEFFNNITATKNHVGQVECTLTIPETNCPMIVRSSCWEIWPSETFCHGRSGSPTSSHEYEGSFLCVQ